MLRRILFTNFRLVYGISQRLRQRFTTNGILVLLVMPIAGVFGFDTRSTYSVQIFSLTLLLIITSLFYALFFRGRFSITRKLPDYATVDTPVTYSCIINNENTKAKKAMLLIDELAYQFPSLDEFNKSKDPMDKNRNRVDRFIGYPRLMNVIQRKRGGSIKPAPLDFIAEHSSAESNIELMPLRRGYIYFEQTRLAKADPLGLFQAQKIYDNKDKLLVLPKIYKTPVLNLHGKRTYQHGGVNNASAVGDSQEFFSLRDYRPGDPMRSIHWKSFAKTSQPIVKEYQDEFFIRYGLILDTFLDNQNEHVFEDAVSVAASFMSAQKEQDALLDLMFIGNQAYRFTSGRGLAGTENILEILACIEPVSQSNLVEMQTLLQSFIHECSALICIMLKLDQGRIKLLNELVKYNVPVKVLLVTDEDSIQSDNRLQIHDMHTIRHAQLQADLDNIQ